MNFIMSGPWIIAIKINNGGKKSTAKFNIDAQEESIYSAIIHVVSFISFRVVGITAGIMSLGGIAAAIGALVDDAIVAVEQTYKRLQQWDRAGQQEDRH